MNKLIKQIKDFKFGIIKVYNTPTLPDHVIKFNNRIYVRVFRVIGGISLLSILSRIIFNYNRYIVYIVIFIIILFSFYHLTLMIYRIIHIYKLLRSDKLDIRNSPINPFPTLFTICLLCIKGVCENGIYLSTLLGTGIAFD